MSKYLAPLGVFIGGNLLLLIVWLFLPNIGESGTELAEHVGQYGGLFWGMSWAAGAVKLFVVVLGEGLVLFATFRAFLSAKN